MAREDGPEFVRWREEFLSQERGSRVVHYYLEDVDGVSHLAVVGTERSLRHMLYVVSEDFLGAQGCGSGGESGPGVLARKWRSRREVVDWLESFLPAKTLASSFSKSGPRMGNDISLDGYGETGSFVCHNLVTTGSSDIIWSGPFWTCSKQLLHYQAFCRNGTTISTQSFVLVMSEEENRYLAYLEDMYEDKKGHKKVKVRWFHQNQEFACAIPPPPPHPCEVFITPYSQVISVECVDDIATVLTPEHYEKYANTLPNCSLVGIRFCFRQYTKNKFKHFDLRTMRGYYSQDAVLTLKVSPEQEKDGSDTIKVVKHCTPGKTKYSKQFERLYSKCLSTKICRGPQADSISSNQKLSNRQSPKKHLSVKFIGPQNQPMPTYNVGEKIEVLSQDSGIVGCWFRCTVLKLCSHNKLKIQYDDLQNADDCGKLEERVPASTLALPDKLELRCPDRLRIRPCPQENTLVDVAALLPGTAVDIWQFSGWWEGVVVSADKISSDSLQVYFPGENFFRVCQLKNARISKDWVKNHWVDIEMKIDVLSRIPPVGVQTRQPDYVTSAGGLDSVSSAMSDQDIAAVQANSSGDNKETGVDTQAEVTVVDKISASAEDKKQTILGEQSRDDDAEQDCNGEETGAGSQTEVIFSEKASTSVEDEKHTILGIQTGNDDTEQDCNGRETGAHSQIEVILSERISASVEDEKQTILGKQPRDDDAEQNCNGHVSNLNDKAFASLEDDEPTILGKRPRDDDAEQNCNGHVSNLNDKAFALEDDEPTILGRRSRDDDAEQNCNGHVSSLNDKAFASLEDDERAMLGKRPRHDDAEQNCNGLVSSLNDKAFASLEDDAQTISGKTMLNRTGNDDTEQDCNGKETGAHAQIEVILSEKISTSVEDEKQTILGKRPRDDDDEQHCNGEVSSLTDKASASKEDEAQTVLAKQPRDDDSEQGCNVEVGVEVDAGES